MKDNKKLVFYDQKQNVFAELNISHYKFDAFLVDFIEFVNLIADSKFTFVKRVDLVSAGRVLMSFVDLRHLSNQKNYTINFNPF